MSKTRVLALAVLLGAAPGASADTIWVGKAQVAAAATACGTSVAVGDYATVTYRPAGQAGNGGDSNLAYVTQRSSYAMYVPKNTFQANINYAAVVVGSWVTYESVNKIGAITAWTASSAFGPTAVHVHLKATFTNFWGLPGCTVSMDAPMEEQP